MSRAVTGDRLPKLAKVIATRNGAYAISGRSVWRQQEKGIFWSPVNNSEVCDLMIALQSGQALERAFHAPLLRTGNAK